MVSDQDPLDYLASADPDLARRLRERIVGSPFLYTDQTIRTLVDEILWGFLQELSFGQAYALGIITVIHRSGPGQVQRYCALVRAAGRDGPTRGKLFAEALVQVVVYDPGSFTDRFLQVTDIMLGKGTYTLKDPLNTLSCFLVVKDALSATRYLELLADVFDRPLTYNRCLVISKRLPRLVESLAVARRPWQLSQLQRVMHADDTLMEPFFEGIEKGVDLLTEKALAEFVERGLKKFRRDRSHGSRFFQLASRPGIEVCRALQVALPLSAVRGRIDRYLQARVGRRLTVKAVTEMPAAYAHPVDDTFIYFDGAALYLKDVIDRFPDKQANTDLYMCLARLESGCAEFRTFDFDLEKEAERHGIDLTPHDFPDGLSDLECFFSTFTIPDLAADLFTMVEHGRLRRLLSRKYPGLNRRASAIMGRELARLLAAGHRPVFLYELYARIALGVNEETKQVADTARGPVGGIAQVFNRLMADADSVEASAGVVRRIFPEVTATLADCEPEFATNAGYPGLTLPFGRKIRPALFQIRTHGDQQLAARVKQRLNKSGFKVYRSDLLKLLHERSGRLSTADVRSIIVQAVKGAGNQNDASGAVPDIGSLFFKDLLPGLETGPEDQAEAAANVFRYPEWDRTQNDYLMDHTRLTEKELAGHTNGFYPQTLKRHQGLVRRIKYAFELLKPEGIKILRQWIEGDDFDYRAMLDFVLDKKAGVTPSDRLYIKRMKSARDVAVMLLVDLSKSTSNTVQGSADTVLDVEKEAIVLFCEALEVVGDTYAIAGFSGTGRLGVDFFGVKGFAEDMGAAVRARVNAMTPQRNTRMGTAIRHAVNSFRSVDSSVKLLIVLGDGYPNDSGYKKEYALEDTRKAVFEARSKNIFTHGITVNMSNDVKMDDLFGPVHHTVISNVRELPDKLWRVYSSLTH